MVGAWVDGAWSTTGPRCERGDTWAAANWMPATVIKPAMAAPAAPAIAMCWTLTFMRNITFLVVGPSACFGSE